MAILEKCQGPPDIVYCIPSLVLIAQVVFLLKRGYTHRHADADTQSRWKNLRTLSAPGKVTCKSAKEKWHLFSFTLPNSAGFCTIHCDYLCVRVEITCKHVSKQTQTVRQTSQCQQTRGQLGGPQATWVVLTTKPWSCGWARSDLVEEFSQQTVKPWCSDT